MTLLWIAEKENLMFQCKKCQGKRSLCKGKFLTDTKLEYHQFLSLARNACTWRTYTQRSLAVFAGLSEAAVSQWMTFTREAFAAANKSILVQLGGPNEIVYVDLVRFFIRNDCANFLIHFAFSDFHRQEAKIQPRQPEARFEGGRRIWEKVHDKAQVVDSV